MFKDDVKKAVTVQLKKIGVKAEVQVSQSRWKTYCTINTQDISPTQEIAIKNIVETMTSEEEDIYLLHNNEQTSQLKEIVLNFLVGKYANPHQSIDELREIAKVHIQKIINGTHRLSDEFWATL